MANKDFVVKNSLIVGDTATINGVQLNPSGATSGQVLKFDGTKFAPASEGDISGTVYSVTIGDGTNSSYTITHGFATRNVVVVIRNAASPYEVINARWEATTTNAITVDFSSPAASDSIIVSVYSTVTGISTGSSYYQTIGNGTDSSFTLTHNFNTRDVVVTARNAASPYEVINARWEAETANTVVLDFSVAPSSSSVRVGVYATVSGTAVASIDDLSDVTITSATTGDLLKWNGSAWVNAAGYATLASPTFTGNVSGITKTMVGLGSVDNTADTAKPVSTAQQTALDLKANLASPTFTGTPTLPTGTIATTQTAADSTTKVATTAFVTTADNLKANIASPTFTGTVTIPSGASISGFAPLASPALTGTPTAPTATANTNTTQVATTAFVTTALSGASASVAVLDNVGDVTVTSPAYQIGDTGPAGGKIFITPSTVGNSTGKYFEISPLAATARRTWSTVNNTTTLVTALGTAIGTGYTNSVAIAAVSGNLAASCAASYARAYSYGGYSDWFLPSKDEIAEVYTNRGIIGGWESTVDYHWSSTDANGGNTAWGYNLNNGGVGATTKNLDYYARPVRSFTANATATAVSGEFLKWNGTAWVNAPSGLTLLKTQTIGTAVSSVTVTGAFNAIYDAYKIIITGGVGDSSASLQFLLGSSAASYNNSTVYAPYTTGTPAGLGTSSGTSWNNVGYMSTGTIFFNCDVFDPFLTKITKINYGYTTPTEAGSGAGRHTLQESYTSFIIRPSSGTFTGGTIAVYGYAKA